MLFRLIYDDNLAQAAYLIGCQQTGDAIVIDPERDVDRYRSLAERHGLRITSTAETHIHADFLCGCRELAEQTGATVHVSDEGGPEWRSGWVDAYPHRRLRDGDEIEVGKIRLRAVHTPGHTPEHLVYEVTDVGGGATGPMGVITGDFVFVGDLGRPDLLETAAGQAGAKEPAAQALLDSAAQFLDYPDHLQVWPAHGAGSACGKALGAVPQSTVGYERRYNDALRRSGDADAFLSFVLSGQPEPPLYFARMKRENRDGPPRLADLPRPAPVGPDGPAGALVVDTRSWPAFRDGHLPGAIYAPISPLLLSVVGSYATPDDEIVLVVEDAAVVPFLVRCLVRIGLDRVNGFATPAMLAGAGLAGARLATTPEIDALRLVRGPDAPEPACVVDVRKSAEHDEGAIPGAINVAHTRLPERLDELPADRPLIVHCATGVRSAAATSYLQRRGYDATNLAGGIEAWISAGGRVARPAACAAAHRAPPS